MTDRIELPVSPGLALNPAACVPLVRTGTHAEITCPLEELGDLWPSLVTVREHCSPGTELRVLYGKPATNPLSPLHVRAALLSSGLVPLETVRQGATWQTTAKVLEVSAQPLSCSVVVPCRNEVDNVEPLVQRLPQLGTHTELLFVDGASTDGTPERIQGIIERLPERDIKLLRQTGGGGKAAAVRQGFDAAGGDVLVILDADMTVAPEDLARFYAVLAQSLADFANGTRFAYHMEHGAMPRANNVGNRAFSLLLSWLVGAHITDTLCGSKAILKRDWPAIRDARPLFGQHDPWGDFDLLLGAAWSHLRVLDVPVRYGARVAGESKMRPLRDGGALLRTCLAGVRQLKLRRNAVAAGNR